MLVTDDRNLVATAVDWATQNPGTLMPNIPVWGQFFGRDPAIESLTLRNSMDRAKLEGVSPQIIPLMVAVNLGRPLEELASTIKHHGITTSHLKQLEFRSSSDLTLIKGQAPIAIEDFHLAFYKACNLDEELADRIENATINCKDSENSRIALIQTSKPQAWLSSWLDTNSSMEKARAVDWVLTIPTDFKLTNPKFWPDGSFGKLLERCGAFHSAVLRGDPLLISSGGQGFWSQLIYESRFILRKDETKEFWSLIADLLDSEYADSTVKALRTLERRDSSKTDFEGIDALTKSTFANGSWVKLPMELMVAAAVSEQDIDSFGKKYLDYSDNGIFEEIADAEQFFFKKASDQFMAIPFEELGWSELRALWKIPRMNLHQAQDFTGVDFEALMTRVLQASNALPNVEQHREMVINGQIHLVGYLAGDLSISSQYLQRLSQDDLEVFVRGGVAPEMRGELSYTAKGRTFRDELGI